MMKTVVLFLLFAILAASMVAGEDGIECQSHSDCDEMTECCCRRASEPWKSRKTSRCTKFSKEGEYCSPAELTYDPLVHDYACGCEAGLSCVMEEQKYSWGRYYIDYCRKNATTEEIKDIDVTEAPTEE